jgi:hypothetical protein
MRTLTLTFLAVAVALFATIASHAHAADGIIGCYHEIILTNDDKHERVDGANFEFTNSAPPAAASAPRGAKTIMPAPNDRPLQWKFAYWQPGAGVGTIAVRMHNDDHTGGIAMLLLKTKSGLTGVTSRIVGGHVDDSVDSGHIWFYRRPCIVK